MFYKISQNWKQQHEIMLNTFSLSLIIWKIGIETWAQEMNGGTNWGVSRAEQFPHLENYTLAPGVPVSIELTRFHCVTLTFDFEYLFSNVHSHDENVWCQVSWNPAIKYTRNSVNGQQQDGRPDGRPENTTLSNEPVA